MLITYENEMVAMANTSSMRKMIAALLYINTPPSFNMVVSIAMVMVICEKEVMIQAIQCTELFNPIIFITYGIMVKLYNAL